MGQGCGKCSGQGFKKIYHTNNLPLFYRFKDQLEPYGVKCYKDKEDENILNVTCTYCGKIFRPGVEEVYTKISAMSGRKGLRQCNLYCSTQCKQNCPTFRQRKYPKGFKLNTSREVQPQLRKMRFEMDNHKCQVCYVDTNLHCHHYEGVEVNPIESADLDNCITLCKSCHKDLHKVPGYTYQDYKRKKCKA